MFTPAFLKKLVIMTRVNLQCVLDALPLSTEKFQLYIPMLVKENARRCLINSQTYKKNKTWSSISKINIVSFTHLLQTVPEFKKNKAPSRLMAIGLLFSCAFWLDDGASLKRDS